MSGIVVIGAGQAGASLATRLRRSGYEGRITLVGAEPLPPYQRPPLSKRYLLGEISTESLLLRPTEFYADQAISLRLGEPVSALDPVTRRIRIGDRVLTYDQLALTTGSVARRLPAGIGGNLAGIHCLRNYSDVDRMLTDFRKARRVLIVGGGFIGLEAAAVAAERGLGVTVLERADRILQRVVCSETSDYFRNLHAARGVDIREGVGLIRLTGDRHVTGAELSDGTRLETDLVIAGIGIEPETQLARSAGLQIDNGIATNAYGVTSIAGIWAAGDCASVPHEGTRLRLESVQNAVDQAECVADNMLGAGKPYVPKPWFWSDQYDVKLQIAGLSSGYRRLVVRGEERGPRSHWYFGERGLLAVDAMNDPRSFMVARRALQCGIDVDPQTVADPAVDLKLMLLADEQQ
nr:FAD-dependent oxidoreductase [Hoeflea alexandrii]